MKLLSKAAIVASFAAPVAFSSPSFAQSCSPGMIADYVGYGSTGCTNGDKIYSDFSFSGFNTSSTSLSITDSGAQHTFSASGLNFGAGTMASYSYKVAIAPGNPNASFLAYRTGAQTSDVFNALVSTKTLTGTPNGGVSTGLGDNGGNVVTYSPTITGPIDFTGTINVTSGRMDVFTDTVVQKITSTSAVPGPLPILGAGAAFGFSRKLRSRIKSAA